jgi:hypothetical protein
MAGADAGTDRSNRGGRGDSARAARPWGVGDDRAIGRRLRNEPKKVGLEGIQAIEADRRKQYRVNPEVVVEVREWEKRREYPDDVMRRIEEELVKRKGRGVKGEA